MRSRCFVTLILGLLSLLPRLGHCEEPAHKPLSIELVSETQSIKPGETFTVALRLRHAPEHHSYWRFPGVVGVPTSMEWDVPAGFEAAAIQWPVPEVVDMRGWKAYGYHGEVLLLVDIKAPPFLRSGDQVTLAGKAVWMCCAATGCTPGFTQLKLKLPVKDQIAWDQDWRPRFEEARRRLPRASAAWTAQATSTAEVYILRLKGHMPPSWPKPEQLYFFNSNGLVSSHEAQMVEKTEDGFAVKLKRFELADPKARRLQGLVACSVGWNPAEPGFHGLLVDAPLESLPEKNPN